MTAPTAATSATEPAREAPSTASMRPGSRSKTVTWCPSATRLPAMAPPMLPRPMTPTPLIDRCSLVPPTRTCPPSLPKVALPCAAMDPAGQHLLAHAVADPGKAAVVMAGAATTRTYAEVADASGRLARALHDRGLRRGDHVAVLLDNQPEFYDVIWAAIRLGAYVTPVNWHLVAAEAGYIVDNCDAAASSWPASLADVVVRMEPYHGQGHVEDLRRRRHPRIRTARRRDRGRRSRPRR